MTASFDSPPAFRVSIAYVSGAGHTARLAEHVAMGARSVPGAEAHLLDVSTPDDDLWATLAASDAVIFGAPTYMGGPAAQFKAFADASSGTWYDQVWKDKIAGGFTVSGHMSGDKLNTLVYLSILAAQHGMIWTSYGAKGGWDTTEGSADDLNRIGSWLGVAAQANKDEGPDAAPPASDLRTGEALGRRVAEVTRQWVAGRVAADPLDAPALR